MIGLLVGGPTERGCYETLSRRLGAVADIRIPGRPGGEDRLLDTRIILNLCSAYRPQRVSRILIVIDSECDPLNLRQTASARVLRAIRQEIRIPMSYFFVRCMLESWFLADREALRLFLRRPVGNQRFGSSQDKKVLQSIVRKAKGDCIEARDWPKLAELVDVDQLARMSTNFTDFRKALME